MRALSAAELLEVWERGFSQGPTERALELLAVACPGVSRDALVNLSIGQRDAGLLTLRESTFGPRMASVLACPHCTEWLELTFDVSDVRADGHVEPAEEMSLSIAGYELRMRVPNSGDLAAAASQFDVERGRRVLIDRCVVAACREGTPASVDQLPDEVVEAAAERMAKADPQADVQLAISCPPCGHCWRVAFDIVSFFWSEIEAWASRILREVHTLASAYGWHEYDILALSPARRQLYLEMADS